MRTLVIGDIHGAVKALKQVIERAAIQKNDQLIFLGDYADGWSQTPEVVRFLLGLQTHYKTIFLRGNHDALCQYFLEGKPMSEKWYYHGGNATEKAYAKVDLQEKKTHIDFFKHLKNYFLDDKNRLFVHAGFTNLRGVENEYFSEMFYWDRTLWELAIGLDPKASKDEMFFPKRLNIYEEIYIGHTPTTRYDSDQPMHAHGVWNVDTGAAFKGRITMMDVDSKQFWQATPSICYTLMR